MAKLRMTPAALSAAAMGDVDNFLAAATPGGIERQEAAGQASFVAQETLPIECPKTELETLGFVFGEPKDDLFVAVTFPDGWTKKATDHSMWSDLLDPKGRKRGAMFYKAAFYDRNAHMGRLATRYSVSAEYLDADLKPTHGEPAKYRAVVVDNATGDAILRTDTCDGRAYSVHTQLCVWAKQWLDEQFPQHCNPLAYWD